ncbi:TY-Chap domain-containing protein [Nocardia sp. N13]|uniref:TY-Chap domain-containing protein n=1 Tax=Nocardioides sp. N13(2025) TaxID=3453405 RepID=UPI003F765F52
MDAGLERRWDGDVETAWTEFRRRLADRLAGLPEDELLLVELAGETGSGTRPYCQALAGEDTLRIEAVSNTYLARTHRLDATQEEALERIGFERPEAEDWSEGETNFFATLEQREADLAAVMIVRAMREVYSVIHPVWLDAGGLEPTAFGEEQPPAAAPRPDLTLMPRSGEEVREAVDAAVAELYEEAPEWDDDGDLPLPTEHHVVWVSVNGANPRVLLHCCLLVDVTDTAAALREVNRLNRQEFGLTFVLRDDKISVCREIAVHVVLPQVLREEAERLLGQVDGWAAELADTLAPQREERSSRPSRFGTAYAVMVELERAQRESVGPATMARIFHHDTGLLLKAIRITEQRRREMRGKARRAREEGRSRDELVARSRQDYMRGLTARMRAALRLVVDAPVRKVQLDQLALFDEDEAGTSR